MSKHAIRLIERVCVLTYGAIRDMNDLRQDCLAVFERHSKSWSHDVPPGTKETLTRLKCGIDDILSEMEGDHDRQDQGG